MPCPDPSADIQVIRLLMAILPEVIQQQFDTLVSEIAATTDKRGFDAASAARRNALRALEMLQVQASCLAKADDAEAGSHPSVIAGIAQGVLRLFDATRHARVKEGAETQEHWAEGFSAVLAMYNSCESSFLGVVAPSALVWFARLIGSVASR